jgi:hypothetical protein
MRERPAACLLIVMAGASCSGDGDSPPTPSADPRQNIMVIDTGIDLSVSELRGR